MKRTILIGKMTGIQFYIDELRRNGISVKRVNNRFVADNIIEYVPITQGNNIRGIRFDDYIYCHGHLDIKDWHIIEQEIKTSLMQKQEGKD